MSTEASQSNDDYPFSSSIHKAKEWRAKHENHVKILEKDATYCMLPSEEDINHPELWKPASWLWLRTFFN